MRRSQPITGEAHAYERPERRTMKYERTNAWEVLTPQQREEMEAYSKEYMAFLSEAKT